jgi:flavodoxin
MTQDDQEPGRRVLLAYYSRAGENYSYGGRTHLQVGNTEVVAEMITDLLAGQVDLAVHRIGAAEPYDEGDYDAVVTRNVTEEQADARPALAHPLPDLTGVDTVLVGAPIWNVRPPMLMHTFLEGLDLTGTTVLPFVTYAVSGLGSTREVYARSCPRAELGEALAVHGEEAQDARPAVQDWLVRVGLLTSGRS